MYAESACVYVCGCGGVEGCVVWSVCACVCGV